MTRRLARGESALFTQSEIERLLDRAGIPFAVHGRLGGKLRFASLRAPVPSAIYYLAPGMALPREISDSLLLTETRAFTGINGNASIVVANPQRAFYKLMRLCFSRDDREGIHASALVDEAASIPKSSYVGPYCVIEAQVEMEGHVFLDSHVVVKCGTRIKSGTYIDSHCSIGASGVAWVWDEDGSSRIIQPQVGGVEIGTNVFIGSGVSIVRGSVNEYTTIGDASVIAPGSKIGHGCRLGRQVHLANSVSLGGNVDTGNKVFLGSGAVVRPRIRIADGVVVGAGAVVTKDITEPNVTVAGVPARVIGSSRGKLAGVPIQPESGVETNE